MLWEKDAQHYARAYRGRNQPSTPMGWVGDVMDGWMDGWMAFVHAWMPGGVELGVWQGGKQHRHVIPFAKAVVPSPASVWAKGGWVPTDLPNCSCKCNAMNG